MVKRKLPKLRLGRKTKLNKALLAEIKIHLRAAIFEKYVWQALQIPESTWNYWKQRAGEIAEKLTEGEQPTSKQMAKEWEVFLDFLETVETTKPKVTVQMVALLQKMAQSNFSALRLYLQTTDPDIWGKIDTLNLKHDMNATLIQKMREANKKFQDENDSD